MPPAPGTDLHTLVLAHGRRDYEHAVSLPAFVAVLYFLFDASTFVHEFEIALFYLMVVAVFLVPPLLCELRLRVHRLWISQVG